MNSSSITRLEQIQSQIMSPPSINELGGEQPGAVSETTPSDQPKIVLYWHVVPYNVLINELLIYPLGLKNLALSAFSGFLRS